MRLVEIAFWDDSVGPVKFYGKHQLEGTMIRSSLKSLIEHLNRPGRRVLEEAIAEAFELSVSEVCVERVFAVLIRKINDEDVVLPEKLKSACVAIHPKLIRNLDSRKTCDSKPILSRNLIRWLEDAWMIGSLKFNQSTISLTAMLLSLCEKAVEVTEVSLVPLQEYFSSLSPDDISKAMAGESSLEKRLSQQPKKVITKNEDALERYTVSLTERATAKEIDPVYGRDVEIRALIDILARRRKNNAVIVGEPGVGKTALVEGLALAIVSQQTPPELWSHDLRTIDLARMMAGASARGEVEARMVDVLEAQKDTSRPIIFFIDEAHMIMGDQGRGGPDLANLMKPGLARGELRLIAATTWAEYKRYFEKDAALERRFVPVKVEAPSVSEAKSLLIGLRPVFEKFHGVHIADDAISSAVELSDRYIASRQLPDKAIDLVDMACGRVKVGLHAKPKVILELENTSDELKGTPQFERKLDVFRERWKLAKMSAEKIFSRWSQDTDIFREDRDFVEETKRHNQSFGDLVRASVDKDAVAEVVSLVSGVPTGRLQLTQLQVVAKLEAHLQQVIQGQHEGIFRLAHAVRAGISGLGEPEQPRAVVLLCGPSGVGKTQTATALAELLMGHKSALTTINLTEYQESHSVSRLVGSPPGYVGYGSGGVLTEAIRQRPHSIVLLDECEKAHPDVMNLFYQVFDKGSLQDGEGRKIDFRHSVIIATSNLGSEALLSISGERKMAEMLECVNDELKGHFAPALLARMTVVPFGPLSPDVQYKIASAQITQLAKRMKSLYDINFSVSEDGVNKIISSIHVSKGARAIGQAIHQELLGDFIPQLLEHVIEGRQGTSHQLSQSVIAHPETQGWVFQWKK